MNNYFQQHHDTNSRGRNSQTNTFTYPESSDIEDGDNYELSENGFDDRELPSSEDDMSVEGPRSKLSQAMDPIDLTGDDSPAMYSIWGKQPDNISTSPHDLSESTGTGVSDMEHHHTGLHPLSNPICVESDEESEGFSSESEPNEHAGSVESDARGFRSPSYSSEIEDSDDEECIQVSNIHPEITPIQGNKRDNVCPSSFISGDLTINSPIEEPEQTTDYDEDSGEDDEEEYESDFGLSDAGREGIQQLREDGLLEKVDNSPLGKVAKELVTASSKASRVHSSYQDIEDQMRLSIANTKRQSSLAIISGSPQTPKTVPTFPTQLMGSFSAIPRHPSPSDAAMVKTAVPQFDMGMLEGQLPENEWDEVTLKAIGDKTGKREFFEARRYNVSTLRTTQTDKADSISEIPHDFLHKGPVEDMECWGSDAISKVTDNSRPVLRKELPAGQELGPGFPGKSIWSSNNQPTDSPTVISNASVLPFLYDPTQVPSPQASPSPEPDMTSSVRYNESKASKISDPIKADVLLSGRSGLSINDIIDDGPNDLADVTLKRKAADISDVIEDEIKNWASKFPSNTTENSTATTHDGEIPQVSDISFTAILTASEHRPVKKVRKYIERLGYAAIGGAAVGATLFSVLVATAPEFM